MSDGKMRKKKQAATGLSEGYEDVLGTERGSTRSLPVGTRFGRGYGLPVRQTAE
jgi:hypothetical protein